MQIRITLMSAVLAVGGACQQRDHDDREGTTTAKAVEPAIEPVEPAPAFQPDPEPIIQLEREGLASRYKDCVTFINNAQLDVFQRECVGENFIGHHMDGMEIHGSARAVELFKGMQSAFSDFRLQPQLIAVSGRNVLAINLVTGTHDHDLAVPGVLPIAKTGKKIGVLFFHRLVLDDENKAVEEFTYSDPLTLLGQLDRLPKDASKTRPVVTQSWRGAPIITVTADSETERANLVIFSKATAAFNAHDAVEMAKYFAADGLESDHSMATDHKGHAVIANEAQNFITAFPDARAEFTHLYAAGDYVIGLGKLTGTNTGPFHQLKATNNKIDGHFAEIAKIENGKIIQLWRFLNGMAIENQLASKESHPSAMIFPLPPQ